MLASVGRTSAGEGSYESVQMDESRSLRTMQGRPAFYDAVMHGNCYGVANQAGVTSQAGLSGTTPVLTLYNPLGSGVNAVIWYTGSTFSVAFAAAATVFVAVGTNTAAAAVTGTLTTAHRNLLLGAGQGNKVQALLAATLPAAPVGVAILGMGLTGAITTVPHIQTLERWFNGGLVLKPGCNLSIQTSAASGASGTWCEYLWEEVAE
jgi:hypothetical protein